ncbi:DUF402 domain-containing protein [Streptomyces pacificus]|uniref:DUF402 domain-containing protein n=1 Tax=Streptomyces pacificus TaxID=2705029 RepID=A0A6A0AYW0_9ACTN|nr:DUF402 domain-containing protein [Streptomyces pacificus]GFH36787.1 DUF402 domain-containing protein [Streptomyces pacificus]
MAENPADSRGRRTVEVALVHAGRTKIRYPAELLDDDGARITVQATWAASHVRDLGFVRFEPGDSFVERYWRDRWHAVKEVRAGDGALKGWYANVTRPSTLDDGELRVEEMGLNLWVSADTATVLRLDEETFASGGLRGRDPDSASRAEAALDELEHMAKEGRWGELVRVR